MTSHDFEHAVDMMLSESQTVAGVLAQIGEQLCGIVGHGFDLVDLRGMVAPAALEREHLLGVRAVFVPRRTTILAISDVNLAWEPCNVNQIAWTRIRRQTIRRWYLGTVRHHRLVAPPVGRITPDAFRCDATSDEVQAELDAWRDILDSAKKGNR